MIQRSRRDLDPVRCFRVQPTSVPSDESRFQDFVEFPFAHEGNRCERKNLSGGEDEETKIWETSYDVDDEIGTM